MISQSMVKYDMTREEREDKSRRIREKGEATRIRHASMRPLTVELKLDLKCLSNAERSKLFLYFTECRWLCNYLIGLAADEFRDFSTKTLIQREYERLSNRRKAIANQAYHDIVTGRKLIVMQDENIKGWHKGLFGKEVQSSALGTLRRKLMSDPNVLVIDRFFPSTRMCPVCGHMYAGIYTITLRSRTGYSHVLHAGTLRTVM